MFAGTYTALVTPFAKGQIDYPRLEKLIRAQIRGGVQGIVPAGTTGESPTLSTDEHLSLIEASVRYAAGKVPVIAGTGANSTAEAIHLTQGAEARGATASLQVTPYYNKPSQEGLFQHFKAIAKATRLPIILYSIPGRCSIAIEVETVARLQKACPNIVAIKEAGGDADRVSRLRQALGDRCAILSGDDALTLPFIAVGAQGLISVASNLLPGPVSRMVEWARTGQMAKAQKAHEQLYPFFKASFVETNPVPIKTAMALAGKIGPELRLPLVPLSPKNKKHLQQVLAELKLLPAKGR